MTEIVMIDAVEMAQAAGIEPTVFRRHLRAANLSWHVAGEGWLAAVGSDEHKDMETVLGSLHCESSQHYRDAFGPAPRPSSSREVLTRQSER
jgi:hypothetical protein